ncbi:hypothetical protein [Aurantiacibacter rhizosphaerae]|uniref:Uncharacterized protein n=1 Tax=Aurantiacibacter rhizosphaerae TaxID=2691582 RepID=A0A844X9I9_9SPHN|nr:hypothetical protein [Aurantiacibacter rhizosphaerae]MWV26616.1 hypothetical protein [Aurantiacibacter rhizosphaerae]
MIRRAPVFSRILLGAVLLLSGLGYFLPMFAAFSIGDELHDPMALRLMHNLDASGLLAVAKFIHIIAGLALLLNRAVPAALAAAMCVNVCAAFIAVFIEGALMPALFAVLILSLIGLLMLACLPAYRPMLTSGAIADGESPEPGENFQSLFVNPLSGASRMQCLAALAPLIPAAAFFAWIVPGISGTIGLVVLALPAAALLVNAVRARG